MLETNKCAGRRITSLIESLGMQPLSCKLTVGEGRYGVVADVKASSSSPGSAPINVELGCSHGAGIARICLLCGRRA